MVRRIASVFSSSPSPPAGPFHGERWMDTTSGIEYVWSGDVVEWWIEGGCSDAFPANSPAPVIGDRFDHGEQQWIWNGIGWALVRPIKLNSDGDVELESRLVVPSVTLHGVDLTDTLGQAFEDIGALQQDTGTLQSDVYTLQSDVGVLEGEVDTLQGTSDGNVTTIQLRRLTTGNVPASLAAGEVAINEADQRLFHRNAAGGVTGFSIPAAPLDALAYSGMQVNGSMDVDQEWCGTSHQDVGGTYAIDGNMWTWSSGAGGIYQQQVADAPPGFSHSLKVSVRIAVPTLAANDGLSLYQPIEGYRIKRCALGTASAKPVSVGFWIKAYRPGTYAVGLNDGNWLWDHIKTFTISASNTWEFKTVTFPATSSGTWYSNTETGMSVKFSFAAGSNYANTPDVWANYGGDFGATGQTNGYATTSDYFQITGLIVLPGIELPSADRSSQIMRPFAEEQIICMRYWEKSYNYADAPGTTNGNGAAFLGLNGGYNFTSGNVEFKVRKRADPTITAYSPNNGAAGYFAEYALNSAFVANRQLTVDGIRSQNSWSNMWVTNGDATNLNYGVFQWTSSARVG